MAWVIYSVENILPHPYLGLASHNRGFRGLDGGALSLYSPLPPTKYCFSNFNLENPLGQHHIIAEYLCEYIWKQFDLEIINLVLSISSSTSWIIIRKNVFVFRIILKRSSDIGPIIIVIIGGQKGWGNICALLGAIPYQLLGAVHLLLSCYIKPTTRTKLGTRKT